MAFTTDDFNKILASTSQLTPYEFSESQYKEGWNFIGGTPPSRQMWDFLQKQNDEKSKYLFDNFDNYLPLSGGTLTGDVLGVTPPNGDNSKKIANTEFIQALASILVPTGCVQAFAGNTVPDGWLLCDGSAVSRTDYAELYSVIGDTYGAGDDSTTFNLPNMSGRVAIGSGTGTDANITSKTFAVGSTGGEYTHKLTTNEMPAHNHTFPYHGTAAGTNQYPCGISGTSAISGDFTMGMNNTGGDAYHNNIQPYTVLQYIIKY